MEDKDIRLRMLAADKPRLVIDLKPSIVRNRGELSLSRIESVNWLLSFENVGMRNIPKALIRSELSFQGLSELGQKTISSWTPEYQKTDFGIKNLECIELLPGQRFEYPLIRASALAFVDCPDLGRVTMMADVTVFVDNGLPSELTNYDLMADLRPVIDAKWQASEE